MNAKKALHIAMRAPSAAALRRVGRLVGDELAERNMAALRELRAEIAAAASTSEGESFAAGYLMALGDLVASFESSVGRALEDAHDLRVAERWRDVVVALHDGARLPSDVASATGKDKAQVTRTLRALREAGLVEGAPPAGDRRQRPQQLTLRGEAIADAMLTDDDAAHGTARVAAAGGAFADPASRSSLVSDDE